MHLISIALMEPTSHLWDLSDRLCQGQQRLWIVGSKRSLRKGWERFHELVSTLGIRDKWEKGTPSICLNPVMLTVHL